MYGKSCQFWNIYSTLVFNIPFLLILFPTGSVIIRSDRSDPAQFVPAAGGVTVSWCEAMRVHHLSQV